MTRTVQEQGQHDLVLARVARVLGQRYPAITVSTNPGNERMYEVQGRWPDIVLVDPAGRPRAIFEVETEGTVTFEHARAEWLDYATLGAHFCLVVPDRSGKAAERIARELGLTVRMMVLY